MRIKIAVPGPGGMRFARTAWDGQVGKTVALKVAGETHGQCRIVAAEVAPDGQSVDLTIEVDDERLTLALTYHASTAHVGPLDFEPMEGK